MGLSPIHLMLLAVVVVLMLGGGRFSSLMGDVAKGVKNFKSGLAEQDDDPAPVKPRLVAQSPATEETVLPHSLPESSR